MEPVRVLQVAAGIRDRYHNAVLAPVNDHVVRMSVMTEPFHWHQHPNSDEFFCVVEGIVAVDTDDGTHTLRAGDTLTIPAGMPHRTRPVDGRSVNITVERGDTLTVELADRRPADR